MKKLLFTAIFLIISSLSLPSVVSSHSGGTDASGCHNCYTDECYGEYHCHNDGYTPYYAPTYIQTPQAPSLTADYIYKPNPDGKTFNIEFDWSDTTNTGYSITLNKYAGVDPGPSVDTNLSSWSFYNIPTGTYYANLKIGINNVWSTVTYWKVEVPAWYPPPTPVPTTIPTATTPLENTSTPKIDWIPLVIFGIVGILVFWVGIYIFYRFIKWFIGYAKEHDWVYTALFWIAIIGIIVAVNLFSKIDEENIVEPTSKSCNCSKTCPNMTCAEAYYQLETCGCSARDADNDGIPCEAQCN